LDLDYLGLPSLDLQHIDGVFTEEEVWTIIKDMPLDKCPVPDGFSSRFFMTCQSIAKVYVMEAFNSLSRLDSRGFGSINEAFVTLLPKKDDAEEIRDFRPISLTMASPNWWRRCWQTESHRFSPRWWGCSRVLLYVEGVCMITS
jgi:hypothetical protein